MRYLEEIIVSDDVERLSEALFEKSISEVLSKDEKGQTVLHLVCQFGTTKILEKLLEKTGGMGLTDQDERGRTPIHRAASYGRKDLLAIISKYSPNWNQTNHKGRTPLHVAAKHFQWEAVDYLVDQGACQYDLDNQAQSALMLAFVRTVEESQNVVWRDSVYRLKKILRLEPVKPIVPVLMDQRLCVYQEAEYWLRAMPDQSDYILRKYTYPRDTVAATWQVELVLRDKEFDICLLKMEASSEEYKIVCIQHQIDYALYDTQRKIQTIYRDNSCLVRLEQRLSMAKRVSVSGFGLAGILAQQCYIDIMTLCAESKLQLTHLELLTLHSPGIQLTDDAERQRFTQTADTLKGRVHLQIFHQITQGDNAQIGLGRLLWLHNQTEVLTITHDTSLNLLHKLLDECRDKPEADTRISKLKAKNIMRKLHLHRPFSDEVVEWRYVIKQPDKWDFTEISHPLVRRVGGMDSADNCLKSAQVASATIDFMKVCQEFKITNHDPLHQRYASGEYLFHYLAYRHLHAGTIVPVIEVNGSIQEYTVHRLIHHQGVYLYLLAPNDPAGTEIKIISQGTDFSELDSGIRDLERGSAGYKSLMHKKMLILDKINYFLTQSGGKIKTMTIGGHSLGGADAQNLFVLITVALAQYYVPNPALLSHFTSEEQRVLKRVLYKRLFVDDHNALSCLNRIMLMTYNGAGVRKTTSQLSEVIVKYLKIVRGSNLDITVCNQRVNKDVVGYVGEAHVLPSTSPHWANVELLTFDDPELLGVHTNFQYRASEVATPNTLNPYRLFTNQSEQDLLSKHLHYKLESSEGKSEQIVKKTAFDFLRGPGV